MTTVIGNDAVVASGEPMPVPQVGGLWLPRHRQRAVAVLQHTSKSGIRRGLAHEDPSRRSCCRSLGARRLDGTRERPNDEWRELVRERIARAAQPSAAILDRQWTKTKGRGVLAAMTEPRS